MAQGVWTQENVADGINFQKAGLKLITPEDKVNNLIKSAVFLSWQSHPQPIEIRKCLAELSAAWDEFQRWQNGEDVPPTPDDGLPF